MTTVTTSQAGDLPGLAQKLRMLAAVGSEEIPITIYLPPAMARSLAHLIDGGGFAGAAEGVISGKVDAAFEELEKRISPVRQAWVDRCQGLLSEAQEANKAARRDMWISLALVLIWGALMIAGAVL